MKTSTLPEKPYFSRLSLAKVLNEMKSELNEIQSGLNVVRNMFNPIPNKDIDSIPKNLQRYLNLVRDGLFEAVAKQNGHNPDSADK